jgi:hypothetical protein
MSPGATATPSPASGLEPGPSLLPVFAATGAPDSFRALGGVTVWWRITIHGSQGEPIGLRDVTHTADLAQPVRDRLEHADGRVFGRAGATVFAERQGMPWPSLAEAAGHQLQLFGDHLRFPFAFADAAAFGVVDTEALRRGNEDLRLVHLERLPAVDGSIGPRTAPVAVDRHELVLGSDGLPREWVHELASSGQRRTVQLGDWRRVGEVLLPFRRVYVDANGQPTTTIEMLRVEAGTGVGDRSLRWR